MLEAVIIGNLGADATIKDFNGSMFISFDVANTEKFIDRNGQPIERTTWISVLKPAKAGDRLCQYLTRGTQVYLRGSLSTRCYQSQSGWRAGLNLHCTQLQLLSSSASKAQPAVPAEQASAPQPVLMPAGDNDGIF